MTSSAIRVVEVGPRDGLQNETTILPVADRIDLIEQLAACGLQTIEAGSFVSPTWVPQMADTEDVLRGLRDLPGVALPVLVPNRKGLNNALAAGAQEIAVFTAASETFSQRNLNCSITESLRRLADVASTALAANVKVRGYVSCVINCPYEGSTAPFKVAEVATALAEMGCYEVSLGDTVGTGTPGSVRRLLAAVIASLPPAQIAVHFHDTWGQALANVLASLELGIQVVDSSVAGLGGCPYARGATGNLATEDLIYMLDGMGLQTGVNLMQLAQVGRTIAAKLGKPVESKVSKALGAASCE